MFELWRNQLSAGLVQAGSLEAVEMISSRTWFELCRGGFLICYLVLLWTKTLTAN